MGKGGCAKAEPKAKAKPGTDDDTTNDDNISTKATTAVNVNQRKITYRQLSSKQTINECWIAYDNSVYDVTQWLVKHPGGIRSIMSAAGSDASAVMKSLHTPRTLGLYMKRMRKVGVLVKGADAEEAEEAEEAGTASETANISKSNSPALIKREKARKRREAIEKDFNALNEKLVKEGWYKPQPWRYFFTVIRVVAMLFAGIALITHSQHMQQRQQPSSHLTSFCFTTLGSMLIGFYFQNVAFAGHDAGHGSITGSFAMDKIIGILIGNLFTGIDMGWWKSTHYVHHSATNSIHDDPDIQHMPLLCLDERMKDNRWSTYHGKYMLLDKVAQVLLPHQNLYFYPVLGVARINLYIQSVIYLIKTCPFQLPSLSSSSSSSSSSNSGAKSKSKAGESFIDEKSGQVKERYAWPKQTPIIWTASFLSLIIFYKTMITFYLSLGIATGVYSFLVTHIAAGLLHVQILLSHICMHYCEDGPGTTGAITAPNGNDEAGYHEWQALSTMDISCPAWMDWFHGGLQFQLEHHIFPRVPRWNLRKLCKLTDEIYAKYDIPVVRMGFIDANKVMLKHMKDVGVKVTTNMTEEKKVN